MADNLSNLFRDVSKWAQDTVNNATKIEQNVVGSIEAGKQTIESVFTHVKEDSADLQPPKVGNTTFDMFAYFNKGSIQIVALIAIVGVIYFVVKKD